MTDPSSRREPSSKARGVRGSSATRCSWRNSAILLGVHATRCSFRCRHRPTGAPAARHRGLAGSRGGPVPCGRTLVTRGHGRRGPCRAQFRSAPSSEHTPRLLSSSSIARVQAARGLFEHGEAHRRACPRGCAFSPPPDGAPCPLLGDLRLVAEADQGSPPVAPATQGPLATRWRHVGAAPTAHGFSTRNVAKILPMSAGYPSASIGVVA